jgi:ribosomal protein S12 methylthiotransferase accessory factor
VLIDGLLVYDYAPSPQEIGAVLRGGIAVVGAASLGALRAVELWPMRMRGVGWVFEQYREGRIDADDEVVTPLAPRTWEPLAFPLVRLRYGLEHLVAAGMLSSDAAAHLLEKVRCLPFEERTPDALRTTIATCSLPHRVAEALLDKRTDVKRHDTLQCLQMVRAGKAPSLLASVVEAGVPLPSCQRLGITRVARTTGLDRLGLPTHSVVRPATADGIWVYSGKGLTDRDSRIAGVMECIERTASLWDSSRSVVGDPADLPAGEEVWGPTRFTERSRDDVPCRSWIRGRHLWTAEPVWAPAELVMGGRLPEDAPPGCMAVRTTNGLGAGFERDQALAHALLEVMERDAVSCVELQASHLPSAFLAAVARVVGREPDRVLSALPDDTDLAVSVRQEGLPAPLQVLCAVFASADLQLSLKVIPNDFAITVIGAAVVEAMGFGRILGAAGYGASPDPEKAVTAAILELAQSRATDLQGAREDCGSDIKARLAVEPRRHWLASPSSRQLSYDQLSSGTTEESPAALAHRLAQVGLRDIAVFDFDRFEGVSVVRVLVPEVETWHPTGGRSRLGFRMAEALGC